MTEENRNSSINRNFSLSQIVKYVCPFVLGASGGSSFVVGSDADEL